MLINLTKLERDEVDYSSFVNRNVLRELRSTPILPGLEPGLAEAVMATHVITQSGLHLHAEIANEPSNRSDTGQSSFADWSRSISKAFQSLISLFEIDSSGLSGALDERSRQPALRQLRSKYLQRFLLPHNPQLRHHVVLDLLAALTLGRDSNLDWLHDPQHVEPAAHLMAMVAARLKEGPAVVSETNFGGPHIISSFTQHFAQDVTSLQDGSGYAFQFEYREPLDAYLEQLYIRAHFGDLKAPVRSFSTREGTVSRAPTDSADIVIGISARPVHKQPPHGFLTDALRVSKPDGLIVVVTPASLLYGARERSERERMVEADMLSAVILMNKSQLNLYGATSAALLILEPNKPVHRRDSIALIDASNSKRDVDTRNWLAHVLESSLASPSNVGQAEHKGVLVSSVTNAAVADRDFSLVPQHYQTVTARPVQDVATLLDAAIAAEIELGSAIERFDTAFGIALVDVQAEASPSQQDEEES